MARFIPALILTALLPAAALAQHAGHGSHGAAPAVNPAVAAYQAANEKMHRDMDVKWTGNADRDFVLAMIPHHQGAVDMAKIVLAHGKDPAIRKLAEEVVKAQETEIGFMRDWLAKQGR